VRSLQPESLHPPFARYAHGVETPAGARLIFCSGQLGVAKDGAVPQDVEGQARLCFAAIAAILAEGGMGLADVVRLNAYVVSREDMAGYMKVRDEFMSASREPPASTLMIVSGFTRPEFKVEVEAVAAKKD
jgi:2-iminobutanoate/2-iminopropanoate deaminase